MSDMPQQQPFNVAPGLSPYPIQQLDPSVAALILTPYDILDALRRTLSGERLEVSIDENSQRVEKWTKPDHVTPMLNNEGIAFVNAQLTAFVNRVASLSDIREEDFLKIGGPTCCEVCIALARDYKKYGLDKSNFYVINNIIDNLAYFILSQAKDGGLRKLLKETTQRVETVSQERKPNKGGLLGWLPLGR